MLGALVLGCVVATGASHEPGIAGLPEPALSVGHDPQAAAAPGAQTLGPRRAIAGLRGLRVRATVHFPGDTAAAHDLDYTTVFPDRARLWLGLRGDDGLHRRIFYRYGEQAYQIPDQSKQSLDIADEGPEAQAWILRELALRNALFLFPDGLAWEPRADGDGNPQEHAQGRAWQAPLDGGLGRLEAETDAAGQLVLMRSIGADGTPWSTLKVTAHRDAFERSWPARIERSEPDGRVSWLETVVDLDVRVYAIDDFFRPPDRRAESAPRPGREPWPQDLEPAVERRLPFEANSLARALERSEDLRAAAGDALPEGFALAPDRILELDPSGLPIAVMLRLAGPTARDAPWPDGWSLRAEQAGLTLGGIEPPLEPALAGGLRERFLAHVPPGASAGTWHVRLDADRPLERPAQVWMSLVPAEQPPR